MKKSYLKVLIMIVCLFILNSCFTIRFVPKEKADELDGTEWFFSYKNGSQESFEFHYGGTYIWNYSANPLNSASFSMHSDSGTYSIEGDKIILIREGSNSKIIATFSEDRQTFSYSDRVFTKGLSWGEIRVGNSK
jgi:hypothetical protein